MYKKQLVFQKMVCMLCIIAAALSFVYALGIVTDIYDSLYTTMRNPNDLTQTKVPGSIIYYEMQNFNAQFVSASITLILLGCALIVTNTHSRRKYYFTNYLATIAYSVFSIAVAAWAHFQIEGFKHQFLTTIDFEAMKEFSDMWGTLYLDNTFLLDAHYVVLGLAVLVAIALLANMIWKINLMRAENALLAGGKEEVK